MNNDDFKKLDAFMHEHVPGLESTSTKAPMLQVKKPWIWSTVAAFGIAALVTWNVVEEQKKNVEAYSQLIEVLEWDVTTDEMPEELVQEFQFLEGESI